MRINRIFLPRAVYELFPLLYLGLGTACMVIDHSPALMVLGAILIGRGLFTVILRINYRSPKQALAKSPLPRRER